MKIEDQVCTLEQAKKFKKLGIVYDKPVFCYVDIFDSLELNHVQEFNRWAFQYNAPFVSDREHYYAFTSAELSVMLPAKTHTWFDGDIWHCSDWVYNPVHMTGLTEADAKAEELLSRIKYEMILIDEINENLKKTTICLNQNFISQQSVK